MGSGSPLHCFFVGGGAVGLLGALGEDDFEVFVEKLKKLVCSLLLNNLIFQVIEERSMGGGFDEALFEGKFLFSRGNFGFGFS